MTDYTANVYNDPCNHDTPTHQIVKEGERFVAYPAGAPRTCENPTRHGFDDASERIPKSLGGLSGRWKEQGRNE
jgi:hypothetical protein